MGIGEGISLANRVTKWIDKFIKRKDANLEKDASKSAMSGDVNKQRRIIKQLYKK